MKKTLGKLTCKTHFSQAEQTYKFMSVLYFFIVPSVVVTSSSTSTRGAVSIVAGDGQPRRGLAPPTLEPL